MKSRSAWALSIVAVLAMMALNACALADAQGSFDRTLKVSGPVDLDIETGSGSITVRTGGADSVQVHATINARNSFGMSAEEKVKRLQANPPIDQTGNTIRIGRISDSDVRQNVSIIYELTVPQQTQLRSHTGSGHQTVDGIRGPLTAQAGSGSLTISNVGGETRCHTGSGSIHLDYIHGAVRAEAGSGSIRANDIAGAFDAHTGSGSVELTQSAPGDVRVDAGSGSIELRNVKGGLRAQTGSGHITASGEPMAAWDVHTGSGGVTLHLPPQASFDLYAHTGSGRISSQRPITMQGSFGRHELRGKVGQGGISVELRTGSGNITID